MTAAPGTVVGREAELELITELFDRSGDPRVVLLEGEPGIGKSILWEAGVRIASERSGRVLSCRPAETEAVLPFSALGDLLEPLLDEALPLLPDPQRLALEVALLRTAPPATPTDRLAVSQATLSILRDPATASTVVAIDDVQWLDTPSQEVLDFVVRRLGDAPIRLLLARRGGHEAPLPLGMDRGVAVNRIAVGPLSVDEIDRVVDVHLDVRLPRPRLVELERISRGNPYYAIEIIRALAASGDPHRSADAIAIPDTIGALLRQRVEGLSTVARDLLLLAAASPHPTAQRLTVIARSAEGLDEALSVGILASDGPRIRFTHPLLASVVYGSASPRERREAHARLAAAASDRTERARHLALAQDLPDSRVSAELEAAADAAARRGAPSSAAELLEHAVRLTPAGSSDDRRRRLAAAAEHLYSAGDQSRSRSILESLIEELPPGRERAGRLAELSHRVPYQLQGLELCRRALDEVGDDLALEADLHFFIAASARRATTLEEAAEHARLAVECATAAGDDARIARGFAMAGHVEVMQGRTTGIHQLVRAVELEASHGALSLHFRASFLYGITLAYLGELDQARPLLQEQLDRAGEHGDEVMHGVALSSLAELELRAGNWSQAHRYATDGAALQQQAAPLQDQAHHVLRAARVVAHMGKVDEARPLAAALLEVAPLNRDRSAEVSARRDLGFIELSLSRPAAAVDVLGPAIALLEEMGVRLFSANPCVHDYVEACVATGNLDEAERANELLAASNGPWEVAMHARGQALMAAARGDNRAAKSAIAGAVKAHGRLGEPFELGRTLLAKGTIERRAKQRAAARATLTEALDIFDSLGAPLWAEKAAAELARIPGRAGSSSDLSETERRVAELVAQGLSNKEVAARLFVTVRTVEANLSKVYAKLGIRSRTELTHHL
ncbi:MAG TPA: AAA family ATPase [Gaiellaceae bacterium]|nr:AAA family ATPase [Gaiellaceae bacterium]